MKKWIAIASLFVLPLFFNAENMDLVSLRNLYYKASVNKSDAETFCVVTATATGIDKNLLTGYSGMSWMIKANHSYNPYNKLSYFFKGKSLLESAIKADPKNVELCFLRYGVQTNAPGFLNYSSNISADKKIILQGYSKLMDADLKKRIRYYMLTSKECTAEEKKLLK